MSQLHFLLRYIFPRPQLLLWYMLLAGCAHIPGTDASIPPEKHEGYALSICMPVSPNRAEACCGYERAGQVRVICTADGGDTWWVEDHGEPQIDHPHDLGETL